MMAVKPPIGLRPKSEVDYERAEEILDAMLRYVKAGVPFPFSWLEELNNIKNVFREPA
jgi:hypothetical protein